MPQCRKQQQQLDLHGCTKLQAIERLTFFLEQIRHQRKKPRTLTRQQQFPALPGSVSVTIITGTGKHSVHGPVLRLAVERTLNKRQMNFQLNPNKGSFCVDALSGIDLVSRENMTKVDTKVIVVSTGGLHGQNVQLVNRETTSSMEAVRLNHLILRNTDSNSNSAMDDISNDTSLLTPSEVAKDDEQIQMAKKFSQVEAAKEQSIKVKEQNELDEAVHHSIKLTKEMEEEERELLREAMELSKQHLVESNEDEEEMIQHILAMSEKAELERNEQEYAEFQAVLALSQHEKEPMEEDDDNLMMEIMKHSKLEQMAFDKQLKMALEESIGLKVQRDLC